MNACHKLFCEELVRNSQSGEGNDKVNTAFGLPNSKVFLSVAENLSIQSRIRI